MNEIQNAIIVLLCVIIIITIITFLYQKQNTNTNTNNNTSLESFANYQDVKTKTINWCNKMQTSGMLSPEQFNSCVATFQDATTGIMPKEFKTPKTGMSRNYSLYNTRAKELSSNITGNNSNNIMLVNNEGFYMGCNKDNTVYFIKDINDSSVNQKELYFTLIPQTNNVYMIISSYGKYLISNSGPSVGDSSIPTGMSSRQDWCATFTGKSMGPMTTWNITVLDNGNNNGSNNGNKATFESVQLSNFFLSSSQNSQDDSLVINYGSDDRNVWLMIPKTIETANSESVNSYSTEYIVAKDMLNANIADNKAQIICVQAFKETLNKLKNIVNINYNNINKYMEQIMNTSTTGGTTDTAGGTTDTTGGTGGTTDTAGGTGGTTDTMSNIQLTETFANENNIIININFSADDKNTIINNILNMKNYYLKQIEADISNLNILLSDLKTKETEIDNDYQNYLDNINKDLSEINNKIQQNNSIINRQKDNYDKLNTDFLYIDVQKEKTENMDKIAKINTNLITDSSNSNSTLIIVYPVIIFLLFMFLIYLIYITYNKFLINVASNY